jgi:hypothetical protein
MDQLDQLHADAQLAGHHLGHLKPSSVLAKENRKPSNAHITTPFFAENSGFL